MMNRLALLLVLGVVGCAGSGDYYGNQPDANNNASDAAPGCSATISYDPPFPVATAATPIRVGVTLSSTPGVLDYTWDVKFGTSTVAFTFEAGDHSQIGFFAPTPGQYTVSVQIQNAPFECSFKSKTINVADPNGGSGVVRLRTVPSPSLAPPQETVIQIQGGGDYNRDIALDSGIALAGTVRNGAAGPGIPAYVKLMPVSAPYAFTEAFSSGSGAFSVRLLGQLHNALVIPTSTTLAPKLVVWMPGMSNDFVVGAGSLVTGTVKDPAGANLQGASVQLFANGVPSTPGTSASNGSFSMRADFPANTPITVRVTPPAGSGLPRLETTASFDLAQSMAIAYSASLQTCNLGGNAVQRGGANQPNVGVTFVGTLAGTSGTVTTGATSSNAVGTVRIATTANGSGVLPTVNVPRSSALQAAVAISATDWAVDNVDTSACAAQIIDAPAQITRTGVTKKNATTTLDSVHVEATPVGALAAADAQPVVAIAGAAGDFSINLASGGTYDVRFIDPKARAAPLPYYAIAPSGVPATATLPKALTISGAVSVTGTSNPVIGASIQILCPSCSGIDVTRPIAQTATDSQSNYRIAVPDPGVM